MQRLEELTRRVRAAHADAWELQGRVRKPFGGGAARIAGARLMASGIPQAKGNNADVTDASVDVGAIRWWSGARGVRWGMRVPVELELDGGEPLFVKRCVAVLPRAAEPASRFAVRLEVDVGAFAALESAA